MEGLLSGRLTALAESEFLLAAGFILDLRELFL